MSATILRSLQKICTRKFHHPPWQQSQSLAETLRQLSINGQIKEAVKILRSLDPNLSQVTSETYLSLIRSCIKSKSLAEGIEIHSHLIESRIKPDAILQNNLIIMYSKCGKLEFASQVFDEMPERNLFSWSAMIGAYSNGGHPAEACDFYARMIMENIRADNFVYPSVLKSCASMKALRGGEQVHVDIVRSGFQWDLVVQNSLIDFYAKCGRMVDARKVFDKMPQRDVFTWTSIVSGYALGGQGCEALYLFKTMLNLEVKPCSATLAGILPVFSNFGCLEQAKQIHGFIIVTGFELDKFVGSALVDMYINYGLLGYGRLVFDRMIERDVVSWNAMIKGYTQRKQLSLEATELLLRMHVNGINPNLITWDCIISNYLHNASVQDVLHLINQLESAGLRPDLVSISALLQIFEYVDEIEQVKEIHRYLSRGKFISDNSTASSLIDMYSKFGEIEIAEEIFECIDLKDLGSWNSMLSCYSNNGNVNKAVKLFDLMQTEGVKPDITSWNIIIAGYVEEEDFETALDVVSQMKWSNKKLSHETFNIILPLVTNLVCAEQGKQLHSMFIRNNCDMSKFATSAFINMYGNCGNITDSIKLFKSMACKDLISWNSTIAALTKNGFLGEALRTFHEMESSSIKPNIITWTTLISGYVQSGQIDEGLKLFRELQSGGLKPNPVTISSILPACAQLAVLSHGKAIHGYIIRSRVGYFDDTVIANALMDMYVKCGYTEYAEHIFKEQPQRDVISWNTMIQGFAIHGRANNALAFFQQMLMEGIDPDDVTFLGVLSACAHAGLIEEGWKLFNQMVPTYGIVPSGKHYACMVNLLGRGGRFEEVRDFIVQMPLQPTASLWGALLSSCKVHGNVEMAEYAAGNLLELQPQNPGNYVVLSNIYAVNGRWDDVDCVRKMMAERGIKKRPGCSWIEIRNKVHAFTAESLSHPEIEWITTMLLDLQAGILAEGHGTEEKIQFT